MSCHIISHVSDFISHLSDLLSHILSYHITHHTSHITHHTSHTTHPTSHISHIISHHIISHHITSHHIISYHIYLFFLFEVYIVSFSSFLMTPKSLIWCVQWGFREARHGPRGGKRTVYGDPGWREWKRLRCWPLIPRNLQQDLLNGPLKLSI